MAARYPSAKSIIDALAPLSPEHEALLSKAYEFSERAHAAQERYSGEPYFSHAAAVAKTLADMKMDVSAVAAGLLHDTLEDAQISEEDLGREFGPEVLSLVQGVTKLGKLKYSGLERHVESLRKFFIAMAADIRVLIIKLADRLHNVSTLQHVPREKQKRIALETLEIYAPLADRLGIGRFRTELENYSFPFAFPEEYAKIRDLMKERRTLSEREVEKIHRMLQRELAEAGLRDIRTELRVKHPYSLYRKLQKKNMDIDKIYDIVALRVIVKTVEDCYKTLGIVHRLWRPLPGRIKDYIALPKPNGYQSIHTTIFTGDGGIVEIQIRTEDMHRGAEYGVASHLIYKETARSAAKGSKGGEWIRELIEWQEQLQGGNLNDYLENLKMDFFKNRVFVFTPQGDVIDLPEESSPIDFAYAIHSDIGDHISGGRVNGKLVPLDTKLRNGDIVEIETRKNAAPKRKWLEYAKTTVARRHIRNYLESNEAETPLAKLFGNRLKP